MTDQPIDLDQDTYQRQRPRSMAEEFGENVIQIQDQPGPPSARSTARSHAARRQYQEQQAREAQDVAKLTRHATEQAEDAALDRAQELIRLGRKVPDTLRSQAMAALRRRGVQLSSAEELAQRRDLARGFQEFDRQKVS
jgi:hypothetical protein